MKQLFLFLALFSTCALSKVSTGQKIITGKVLDDSGHPLIGATVLVKGTSIGTITDTDGSFALEIPDKKSILIISSVGYETREIKVRNQEELTIVLSLRKILDEIVVTGYHGEAQKKMFGKRQKSTAEALVLSPVCGGQKVEPWANWNTEDYDHISENRFYDPSNTPLSTFSIDVDAASYSNIRRFLNSGQMPPKDAVRIEEMVNYFAYDYSQPIADEPFSIITELSECPWNKENHLLHIGLQGKDIPTEDLPASNLVFLLDVSGSMNQPNKLPLVISSFKLLVNKLRQDDRVAIVVYAGSSGLVLPSISGANKEKIIASLERLRAGGSTAGSEGIELAYKIARENFISSGNNRVILATDGDFNVGVSSDAQLVRIIEKERESGVFLTVLGFGMGNYKDNKMQELADHGNGNHGYIDNILEAQKVFIHEFGGTLFTIAKDVKIQLEFNSKNVKAYRLIGYENRLLDKEDFNDDKKDAGEIGTGHTVTALYEIIPQNSSQKKIADVDALRYQSTESISDAKLNNELMFLKIRYKEPKGDTSQLISKAVENNVIELRRSSDNFKWSAAVAEFGMLLRGSEYKKDATYKQVEQLASESSARDPFGYRGEFLRMVQSIKLLAAN